MESSTLTFLFYKKWRFSFSYQNFLFLSHSDHILCLFFLQYLQRPYCIAHSPCFFLLSFRHSLFIRPICFACSFIVGGCFFCICTRNVAILYQMQSSLFVASRFPLPNSSPFLLSPWLDSSGSSAFLRPFEISPFSLYPSFNCISTHFPLPLPFSLRLPFLTARFNYFILSAPVHFDRSFFFANHFKLCLVTVTVCVV